MFIPRQIIRYGKSKMFVLTRLGKNLALENQRGVYRFVNFSGEDHGDCLVWVESNPPP